jgi:HK97 family phage prohead protease
MPTTAQLEAKRSAVYRATDPSGRLVRSARLDSATITREANEDGSIGFRGEAIVFDTPTWIGSKRWGFWEEIAPEAVTKTLREADVRLLQNHDPNLLLARTSAGSLRSTATATGVEVDADMAPTSYALDAAILLERRDLREMSFAFEPLAWDYEERDGEDFYRITELALYDEAIVTFPAYQTTSAGLRSVAFDAMCRAIGLDAAGERRLLTELTGAPDEVLDALPLRARDLIHQIAEQSPADTTAAPEGGASRDDSPPADTTGAPTTLLQDHLALRTKLIKEKI